MGLNPILGLARHGRGPAISQVIDLVVAFLLFFPEGQVLLEKFDDALGIAEVVLLKLIDFVEGLLEGVISELASFGVVLQDFVVEDGEVESQAELDGVAGRQIDVVSLLVGCLGLLLDLFKLGVLGVLSDIAVVITDHFHEEGLGLVSAIRSLEHARVDHVNDLLAVSLKLLLDLRFVSEKCSVELGVLRVLLDGGDGAAGGTLAADEVLEGDGEQVAFVGVDGAGLGDEDLLEEVDHVFEALGLLGDSGEENFLFNVCHGGFWVILKFLEFKLYTVSIKPTLLLFLKPSKSY